MKRDLRNPLSKSTEPSFREAFAKNKKAGKKQFQWKNKNYSTQTAEEKGLKMTDDQVDSAGNRAYTNTKGMGFNSKSHTEIFNSYVNEMTHRIGDKITKQGLDVTKTEDRRKSKNIPGASYGTKRPNRLKRRNGR